MFGNVKCCMVRRDKDEGPIHGYRTVLFFCAEPREVPLRNFGALNTARTFNGRENCILQGVSELRVSGQAFYSSNSSGSDPNLPPVICFTSSLTFSSTALLAKLMAAIIKS